MAIVLEKYSVITPLGLLDESVENLLAAKSAVTATSRWNIPCSIALLPTQYSSPQAVINYFSQSLSLASFDTPETLFIFAAAKGDISAIDNKHDTSLSPTLSLQAEEVASLCNLTQSSVIAVSNACAAGAAAIDTAKEYLENKLYSTVIIMGYEFISHFTLSGFSALSALSQSGARPFDKSRTGMSLGEGAGCAIFTQREVTDGDIVIAGTGFTNDANHRTGPSRTGDELAFAITKALTEAKMTASDISTVKCHGTATPYNDAMEAKALQTIFAQTTPPAVSLKGALGHLSGAGSLIEVLLLAEFLKKQQIPPTMGFLQSDDDVSIGIAPQTQSIGTTALALAAGFGGLNSALVLVYIKEKYDV